MGKSGNSGEKWLKVGKSWEKLGKVGKSGEKWKKWEKVCTTYKIIHEHFMIS